MNERKDICVVFEFARGKFRKKARNRTKRNIGM